MSARKRKLAGGEEGATLLEFAFVAFTFIIMLLSIVEMGRMVMVYTALNDAARAGVRYAIVHGSDNTSSSVSAGTYSCGTSCTGVALVVEQYARAGLINPSNLTTTVTLPGSGNAAGQTVKVVVSYTYDPLVSWFSSRLSVNMGATSEGVIVF